MTEKLRILNRDRIIILAVAAVALIVIPVTAIQSRDNRFWLLLVAILWMLAIAYVGFGPHRARQVWAVIGIGALLLGGWTYAVSGTEIRSAIDKDYKAKVLVLTMLENCTEPEPVESDLRVQRELTARTTHLVVNNTTRFDYGAWRVSTDTGDIYAANDTSRNMVTGENACKARTSLPD
jgi:hypothetical protein